MTSALLKTAYVGVISYAFCWAFNQHNAFEKAVLVTVLVGLRNLAEEIIKDQRDDRTQTQRLTRVLVGAANLLAIPCALYAGRIFNFKAADYLHIVGLASLGGGITYVLKNLYPMLPKRST
jgi:hypothetical protein